MSALSGKIPQIWFDVNIDYLTAISGKIVPICFNVNIDYLTAS